MNPNTPRRRKDDGGGSNDKQNILTNRGFGYLAMICLIAAVIALTLLLHGCAPLLTGTTDPGKVAAIMESTNARGCIFTRASASPWASAVIYLMGTWGDPAPELERCWKVLPPLGP